MRLLLVTSHFYPENFKCNDMAFELVRRGHEVTVLAPIPDYPQGRYYDGYGVFRRRKETVNGVDVIRTVIIPRGKGSKTRIALNYLSHTLFSSISALRLAFSKRKFDAVIVHETSPVLIAIPAVILKKIRKIPMHFWILDLWPESLEAAGGITNRTVLNLFGSLSRWLYKNSDTLLTGSKGYRESINRFGDFDNRITYFPNWVEYVLEHPKKMAVPDFPEGFNVLIAGNMGDAQDLPHLMDAARRLDGKGINFILAGDGRKRRWVEDYIAANRLTNVHPIGSFPLEAMPSLFAKADLLLMALTDNPVFALTIPGRLQAYMSSGKPIAAMINGEAARLIEDADCGWTVPAGASSRLAELLLKLSTTDKTRLTQKGNNARLYAQNHFRFSQNIDHLEHLLRNPTK